MTESDWPAGPFEENPDVPLGLKAAGFDVPVSTLGAPRPEVGGSTTASGLLKATVVPVSTCGKIRSCFYLRERVTAEPANTIRFLKCHFSF
jgi:hypothetical protein